MRDKRVKSVWDEIESPIDAQYLKLRSQLMGAIIARIERGHLSHAKGAKLMSVSREDISNLTQGRIDQFSIEMLITMAAAAGLRVEVSVGPTA
jgi:predicted XRE-type DNA-binding protein